MTKTYGTRGVANPHNHEVYKMFTSKLGLSTIDDNELIKRGLTPAQIRNAGYASKGNNKDKKTYAAMAETGAEFDLDEVPGFHIDVKTGHRTMAYVSGLAIPVYDFNGHIKGLLIRNDRAKLDDRTGKVLNKYVGFSSSGKLKGGRTYNGTHCPMVKGLPKDACGTTAYLTEGVLKSDVVTGISSTYCLGIQGLNIAEDLIPTLEQLEISVIKIAFDAGEDENVDIVRGKARVIKALRAAGIDVFVCKWNAELGKGLDDIIKAGHEDKIEMMTDEEIDSLMRSAKEIDPFTGEWTYCIEEERVYSTVTFKSWKKQQFADLFGMVKGEEVSKLIAERKLPTVERTTYWPGMPLFVEDGGYKCLNIWRGTDIKPQAGDVTIFKEFIDFLIPDEFERKCVLQWSSYMIRNQGDKILYALMMVGGQGVGKSLFVRVLTDLIGPHNRSTPTTENLLENYNGYVTNKSLCVVEEVKAPGRHDIHNKLKTWITEDTIMVRIMNRIAYEVQNRINFILLTNFIDALPIDDDDRRFLFAGVPNKKMPDEFYEKLIAWLSEPINLQAVMQFFYDVDMTGFNAKGRAPLTTTKRKSIASNLTQLEEYVISRIEDAAFPFHAELTCIRHLRDRRICPPGLEKQSDVRWSDALKKAGAIPLRQIRLSDKSKVKLWAYGPQKAILSNPENTSDNLLREMYEKSVLDIEPGNPLVEQSNF